MIIIDLLYNLSVLIALTVLSGFINIRYKHTKLQSKILQGLLFGGTAVIGMMNPFTLTEGIIFDGRSIVISLCTLFFGPVSGTIAAAAAILYRLQLGGGGLTMGLLVIISSFLIGYFFYTRWNKPGENKINTVQLYLFGLLVHIAMLILVLSLPSKYISDTYEIVAVTVIGFYPVATVVIGKILLDREESQNFLNRIAENEKLFRTTLYSIGDAVITTYPDSRIRHMNPVAEQLTGWKEDEAQGKSLTDIYKIVNEDTHHQITAPLDRIIQAGTLVGLANHTLLISKDGKQIPIADSGAPIKDDKNNIIGIVLVFRDQTEERAKEKLLVESEEKFRLIVENQNDLVVKVDAEGLFTFVSPSYCKLFGKSREELIGKSFIPLIHEEDRNATTEAMLTLYKKPYSCYVEQRALTASGWRWLAWSDTALLDKNGNVDSIIGVGRDITDRKIAQMEVEKTKSHFQKLIENAPDGIVLISPEGKFKFVSASAKKMFGFNNVDSIELDPNNLTHPEDLPKVLAALNEIINDPSHVPTIEYRFKHYNGNWIWIESTFTNLLVEPSVGAIVINFREITERKRTEDALEQRLLALTSPIDSTIDIKFEDLFELDEIQKIQDAFAKATGVASIITDTSGRPITKPSNFCNLCENIIRKTDKGLANCYYSDKIIGRSNPGGPIMQLCLSGGLWDGGASIRVGENHIANWLIGQVYDDSLDKGAMLAYAKEIGVDENEFKIALENVTRMPKEQFAKVCNSLYLIAEQLSKLALQNVQQARYITESRLSREAIKASEELYRTLIDTSPDAITVADRDGSITYISNKALELYGHKSITDVVGHNVLEWISEVDRQKAIDALQSIIKGIKQTQTELLLKRKDESLFWAEVNAAAIFDKTGSVKGLIIIARDVSARKQTERVLQESEEKFRSLFENSPNAIFISDPESLQILYCNSNACKMNGYEYNELIGQSLNVLHPKEISEKIIDAEFHKSQMELLKQNQVVTIESSHKRKDGTVFQIESSISLINIGGKTLTMGIDRDITERKQSEEKMKLSEERYKTLFESSPVGVLLVDDKGIILEANKSYCRMMGYLRNELVGNNIKMVVSPDNHSIVEKNIRDLLSGKVLEHYVESISKSGKVLSLQLSETRITLPDNRTGILSISIDITERKQFEHALKESESSYRGLFNSVSEAIYILDENGTFIDVNDGALKMYGFKKEELVGKTPEYVSIEGKNDLLKVAELLGKAFKGENQKIEFWGKRKNGSAFLKEIRLYPGKYFNKPVVIALAQDITERKRLETVQKIQYNIAEAVVSSKNLTVLFDMVRIELSNIINVKNFFIALYDENTGMLRSDVDEDEIEKISEWSAKNSMTGYVIETQKSLLLSKTEINNLIETGVANMVGIIPEVWLGVPFKVSGKVIGVLVIQSYTNPHEYDNSTIELLDIVAHELSIFIHYKRTEEQALKLSTAVEQSPATIVITDLKGDIEYVNPKFSELTGYSFEDVRGRNPRLLNSGTKPVEEYKGMWELILSGKEWRGEFLNKKKNGELFWESATISPIINNLGEITNFIAIKEDITAQKKMTEELIAAKDKAEEMNRIKSYFYANMSHELRTPFVGILGYSELLTESLLDEDQHYMANQILASSRRLTETLNKVLDITKLEFDKIEPVFVNTDIFEMINSLQSLFIVSAEKKNTVIKTVFGCEPFLCKTDERLLREVLTNLINNAIKFTKDGVITISVEKISKENKDYVIFKVADTGTGIPKDKQELIWQEFRQVSEGLNRSFEGTGLGLTIVKKYTELLSAQIFVESEVDKGSVFTIELPFTNEAVEIEKQEVKEIRADKIISAVEKEIRPKILYVEDDPVAVQFVSYVLQKNYDVDTIPDANKALQMLNASKYELLLIDINLGHGIDGVELTQLIRLNPDYENTPIIAVTAYAANNDKEEFLSKGFSHYLSKPFTINQLKELLMIALG